MEPTRLFQQLSVGFQYRASAAAGLIGFMLVLSGCVTAPAPAPDAREPSSSSVTPQPATPRGSDTATAPPAAPPALEAPPAPPFKKSESLREFQRGIASWYGPGFHGRRTANGERFDMGAMTAAHKTLPFGTRVRVRSLVTGQEVDVRVNDRGPFIRGRIIDLSRSAAQALGLLQSGVKDVQLFVIADGERGGFGLRPDAGVLELLR